jgi:hypothetical protein
VSVISSILFATLVGSACAIQHSGNGLAPSSTAVGASYVGTWISSASSSGSNACSGFEWRVTNQTGTMISGLFFARCPGNLTVSGSAWGELKESGATTIPVSATAGATGPGVVVCEVSIKGTASVDGDTIRMPYSGTTCQGPVSGTEVLQRH